MFTFLSGFFIGLSHVLTGPDHLAAVIPFSINMRKKAWLIGLTWGLGHTAGAILIGVIFLIFKEIIPMDIIGSHSETMIGVMLIVIGLWSFYRIFYHPRHSHHVHPHFHDKPVPHIHTHGHDHDDLFNHTHSHDQVKTQTLLVTTGIGTLHGLAGFTHLLAVLPSLVLPGRFDTILYLSAFGLGTVVTMVGFTALLGYFAYRLEQSRRMRFIRILALTGATLSVLIGILWMIYPF